jgi:flagellar assembly protein FliH
MDELFRRSDFAALFDEDFDHPPAPPPPPEPEVIEPTFTAGEVEAARENAWHEGHEAGTVEAKTADTAIARQVLIQVAAQMEASRAEVGQIAEQSADAIARVLLDCFAAAFPAISARHGEREVQEIIRSVLPALRHEPKIAIRLHPAAARCVREEIEQLDPDQACHIDLIPTDAMGLGDVRISWRNGAAVRDTAALWQQIADILAPAGLLTSSTIAKEIERVE